MVFHKHARCPKMFAPPPQFCASVVGLGGSLCQLCACAPDSACIRLFVYEGEGSPKLGV